MLPNFFVVGANKAGTTSFAAYIGTHPDVFMSPLKEPSYWSLRDRDDPDGPFLQRQIRDRPAYEALFAGVRGERAIGEASTNYLQTAVAADRIRAEIPEARIIAVLRDPSDRAFSAYNMHVGAHLEPLTDFGAAVDAELAGGTWRHYLAMGYYAESLDRWIDHFGRDRVRVFLYEDLVADPAAMVRETFAFLGVDPDFVPPLDRRHNVTQVPRHRSILRFAKESSPVKAALKRVMPARARARVKDRVTAWNTTAPPPLTPELRARLVALYADDIDRTATVIGRDLSAWRSV
ncbi:MAG: sulfotransferase [Actinobacteria bacterium]|nr:sulfotransferase [Actinomycetota bacterium]